MGGGGGEANLGVGEVERGAPYLLVPTALPGHRDEMLSINLNVEPRKH